MNRLFRLIVVLIPIIAAAAVNFLSLPLIYRGLTRSEAGIWFILIDIAAIALAFDFGISNIQIRNMAQNVADSPSMGMIFNAGKYALGRLSFFILLLGILASLLCYIYIDNLNTEIIISFIIFTVAISVNLYGYSFLGLLRVHEKFDHIAAVAVFSSAVYLLIIILFINLDVKLIILSTAYLVRNLINFISFSFFTKNLRIHFTMSTTLKYTREHVMVFINTITLYLYLAVESILISIYYGPAIVAAYVAQRKLFDFTKSGVDAYLSSIFPKMSRDAGGNFRIQSITFGFAITAVYLSLYLITPIIMGYIAGSKYKIEPLLIILIAFQFIFGGISTYIRQANIANRLSTLALVSAISEILIKIAASYLLIPLINYKAIPISSIIGALASIFIGKNMSFRGRK